MKKNTIIISIVTILLVFGVYKLTKKSDKKQQTVHKEDPSSQFRDYFLSLPKNTPAPKYKSPYYIYKSSKYKKLTDAPIWIAIFSDYYCSHCQYTDDALKKVIPKYKDKINVAQYFFPLNQTCNEEIPERNWPLQTCDLTLLSLEDPKKFKEISEDIYSRTKSHFNFTKDSINMLAKAHNIKNFRSQKNKDILKQMTDTSKQLKESIGETIDGTPTMIINGRFMVGGLNEQQFEIMFDEILKNK